jgi:hypothetical protein
MQDAGLLNEDEVLVLKVSWISSIKTTQIT